MAMDEIILVLKMNGEFQGFSDDELEAIAARMQLVRFKAGAVIFDEGVKAEVSSDLCIVAAGEVDVFKNTGSGRHLLATLSEGSIFGEMSLLDNEPRSATCAASCESDLVFLSRLSIEELGTENRNLAAKLVIALTKIAARKIRATMEHMLFSRGMLRKFDF